MAQEKFRLFTEIKCNNETFIYIGNNKKSALEVILSLPKKIQANIKIFFRRGSKGYNYFSVKNIEIGYLVTMIKPGKVPGSNAIYQKIINKKGETIVAFKETYDYNGDLIHTKDKIKED
jgi:hypothetical protein